MNFINQFVSMLRPATYETSGLPKARNDMASKRQKTKKGAVHKVNPTFRSRQIIPVTPAQYRHLHLGNPEKAKIRAAKMEKKVSAYYGL